MDLFVRAVTQSARDLLGRSRKGGRDLASEIDVEIFRPPQCVYTIKFFCSDDRSDVKGDYIFPKHRQDCELRLVGGKLKVKDAP